MKSYNRPDIELLDTMEGVYAASGSSVVPTTTPTPEAPFNYQLVFADLNCGGYSTVQFLASGCVNTHKYGKLILTIDFNSGLMQNILDVEDYMKRPEVLAASCMTGYSIETAGNKVTVTMNLQRLNMTDTVEFKFGTKFHHNDSHNANGNSVYGAYNGFTNDTMSITDKEVRRWAKVSLVTVNRI